MVDSYKEDEAWLHRRNPLLATQAIPSSADGEAVYVVDEQSTLIPLRSEAEIRALFE